MRFTFYNGKKSYTVELRETGFWGRVHGLMFRTPSTSNLLFEFNKPKRYAIHSWFVLFPFLAVWLDAQNKVIESRIVGPFCFSLSPRKAFQKLVEMPLNGKNERFIRNFVEESKSL